MSSIAVSVVSYFSCAQDLTLTVSTLAQAAQQSGAAVYLTLTDNTDDSADSARLARLISQWTKDGCLTGLRGFRFRQTGLNLGYGNSNNQALQANKCEFVLVLNPDVALDAQSLKNALQAMAENRQSPMLAPRAMSADGTDLKLSHGYPTVAALFGRAIPGSIRLGLIQRSVSRYELHRIDQNQPHQETLCASGCFMLIRSSAWTRSDGFDDRYFMYFEDYDLSLRLREQGNILYDPATRLIHGGGQAASKGFRHRWLFIRSAARFFSRHGWRWL